MLRFELGLQIWVIITFVALLLVLWKTAWPAIINALEERENHIRTSLEDADKAKEEAKRIMAEYKDMISKAKSESAGIIKQGTEKAEQVREELILKAKEESRALVEKTIKELELESAKAVQDLKQKTIDISVAIAAKIITSSLTIEQQAELAKKAMQELETGK